MSDQWDDKAREMLISDTADSYRDWARVVANALRAAYEKGVEDSAKVADSYRVSRNPPTEVIEAGAKEMWLMMEAATHWEDMPNKDQADWRNSWLASWRAAIDAGEKS